MRCGRVIFLRDELLVAKSACRKTETFRERNKGLLGVAELHDGLWISPCNSIHMFFMQISLDIVYLDKWHRVCKLVSEIKPWQVSASISAHSVLELAAGKVSEFDLKVGDQLVWQDL